MPSFNDDKGVRPPSVRMSVPVIVKGPWDKISYQPDLAGIATRADTRIEGMDALTYMANSIYDPESFIVDGFPRQIPLDRFASSYSYHIPML